MPLVLPIAEAQRVLGGISRTAIYRLAGEGRLKKIRIGRRGLITMASIKALVDQLAEAPAGEAVGQSCTPSNMERSHDEFAASHNSE
ncbi:helix-turn-helix domain-containing protein [Mycolicibacterium pulveris]